MAKDSIPYALLTQELEVPEGDYEDDEAAGAAQRLRSVKIWVCLNLIDHRVMGLGLGREAAIEAMRAATMATREGEAVKEGAGRVTKRTDSAARSVSMASARTAGGNVWEATCK